MSKNYNHQDKGTTRVQLVNVRVQLANVRVQLVNVRVQLVKVPDFVLRAIQPPQAVDAKTIEFQGTFFFFLSLLVCVTCGPGEA